MKNVTGKAIQVSSGSKNRHRKLPQPIMLPLSLRLGDDSDLVSTSGGESILVNFRIYLLTESADNPL